jgi:ABC-type microcin C transport system permease subunit YejB
MNKGLYKYYADLPSWAKGIVVVGGVAIVGLFSFKIYKKLFPSDQEKKNKELANGIDAEISKWIKKGQKASFNDSNYLIFANTIYDSMRYAIGDDYGKVVDTMELMKNDLDVAKLIKAFGNKQNYSFGIPTGSPLDLFSFVQSELGSEFFGLTSYRVTKINDNWAKKGITYKI